MKLDRLFHVLVVLGGASLGGGCDGDDSDPVSRGPAPDASPAPMSDAGSELQPCFCDVEICCDRSSTPVEVVDGFECCWSTTCP